MKQVLKVVISAARIWVGLSSTDVAENTQEIFGWVSSAVKTYLGYLCFVFKLFVVPSLRGKKIKNPALVKKYFFSPES